MFLISTSAGLIESLQVLTGSTDGWFITLMTIFFLLTLFGNMISWSLGVNNVARYAARNGDMPAVFAKSSAKNDMPTGSAVMNGVVASAVILLAPFIPNEDLFWSFFALNLVMFLLAYIPIFPAFLKLRKIDPDTERPFRVNGGPALLNLMAWVPVVLILIALIFVAVPLSFDAETLAATLPITIGAIICLAIGEAIIIVKKVGK